MKNYDIQLMKHGGGEKDLLPSLLGITRAVVRSDVFCGYRIWTRQIYDHLLVRMLVGPTGQNHQWFTTHIECYLNQRQFFPKASDSTQGATCGGGWEK